MARWNEVQRDFSGGEVGSEFLMRDDTGRHKRSVLIMENYMPMLQGGAVRVPGTRYVQPAADPSSRLIPFITPDNRRALVELRPDNPPIIHFGLVDIQSVSAMSPTPGPTATEVIVPKALMANAYFLDSFANWDAWPRLYYSADAPMGWQRLPETNNLRCSVRDEKSGDARTCTIQQFTTLTQDADFLTFLPSVLYAFQNGGYDNDGRYELTLEVLVDGVPVFTHAFKGGITELGNPTEVVDLPGHHYKTVTTIGGPFTAGQRIGVRGIAKAQRQVGEEARRSYPTFVFGQLALFAAQTQQIELGDIVGDCPWTAEEMQDVQYVQSPYPDSITQNQFGNELVFVHPNHPPHRLYFDSVNVRYELQQIQFKLRDDTGAITDGQPAQWEAGAYPSAVTSYLGRCVFAGGSQIEGQFNQTIGSAAQTVWATVVGKWDTFSHPDNTEQNTDDSVEFTSTYRSPIQWVLGQRFLLVGAQEMEYVSSSDGIFSPGDLGVTMQSTHGSNNVQPVNMGQWCLFPANGGTSLRRMSYDANDESWVSPDLTLIHPTLLQSRVRRMVRMRNPHQMAVVVTDGGDLLVLHIETYADLEGWSRMDVGGEVLDACVLANEEGLDVLYLTVRRIVLGVQQVYIESVVNWQFAETWTYVSSAQIISVETPTNVFTGLNNLDGATVQVVGDGNYLGEFTVSDATLTLTNDIGQPINVSVMTAGYSMSTRLLTLPHITDRPDSLKKYKEIIVRGRLSARPLINGERPADRDPQTIQEYSQPIDIIRDYKVTGLGRNPDQAIEIVETVPVRSELIGIFGTIEGHDL